MNNQAKILTVLASPRVNGLTAQLLEAAEKQLEDEGCEVVRVNVSELQFKACRACMKCRQSGLCHMPFDDAHKVDQYLLECDGLIVATPTYLGGLPGETKMLFDRLVSALMDTSRRNEMMPNPRHIGKPIGVIVTSSACWPLNMMSRICDTSGTLRRIFTPSGFEFVSTVRLGNTKKILELKPSDTRRAEKMAHKVSAKAQIYFARRQKFSKFAK